MIAEIGLATLWMAAGLSLFLAMAGFAAARGGAGGALAPALRPVAVAQALLCGIAMLCLLIVFAQTDLSVLLVASNSHVDKPFVYKVAGAWGNHEGSMLLWVTILSLASGAIALFARRLEPRLLAGTIGAQALLALGFFAFLLFASNPFARLFPAPIEGLGLNPLLQDPGLAFHPPTLYLGYVGLSVAFSFAVSALITGQVGPQFARAMRPWVLGAWLFLTLGITAGSYWAYYELGWGGWWFWDPVENASLMPWLAATALLHSVSVLATRDSLRAWTVMLALVAFAMSMVGTFLVRSGILTSVHAFAIDPRRGAFILTLLFLYIGAALTLFAVRVGSVREGSTFEWESREAGLVANNLLLSAILGIVLVGTLYPILAEAMGTRLSVGAPYFNVATLPLAFLLIAVLSFGPLLRWRRDKVRRVAGRLLIPAAIGVAAGLIAWLAAPGPSALALIGFALSAALLPASILPLFGRKLGRAPLTLWAMVLAHAGVAVSGLGMASDALFTREVLASLKVGESRQVGPWSVQLAGVEPVVSGNWTGIEATLVATRGGSVHVLSPISRTFARPATTTAESAIVTALDGQLYTVLAAPENAADLSAGWQLRLWWKPLVTLIWLGGAMIALGGALALLGRWSRPLLRRRRMLREPGFA